MARSLAALLVLLVASQLLGGLFQRLRQPRVIGEILGGLLCGPTVLGAISPHAHRALFNNSLPQQRSLTFVFWLGLLLLMFCSGLEAQNVSSRSEWRTALWLTGTGTVLPLAFGWAVAANMDFGAFFGPRASATSFGLILAMAIAVTSIPVISKILFDLGLIRTGFARVVLTTAMIEDLLLWVLLSITLGITGRGHVTPLLLARGVLVTVAFCAFCLLLGHRIFDGITGARWNPFSSSAEGMPVVFVFLVAVVVAHVLGVNPIFGAFLAGRIVGTSERIAPATRQQIVGFSFAMFIPIYFASVGLKLDLRHSFSPKAFLLILAFACAVKAGAAFVGATLSGQRVAQSVHLAVAMNARGGPGIVLATVAVDAKLINADFYAILVMLSLATSQLAGWWLSRVNRLARHELDLDSPALDQSVGAKPWRSVFSVTTRGSRS